MAAASTGHSGLCRALSFGVSVFSIAMTSLGAQTVTRMSVDSNGKEAQNGGFEAAISADGRYVAFSSNDSHLVPHDKNGHVDVFVHDRLTGLTTRESVDSTGAEGNSDSDHPTISADGQLLAFVSYASNLVSGDTNGLSDIFVRDRVTGTTIRVSVSSSGAESDGYSDDPSISANGEIVGFQSNATNLVASDTNFISDVFIHDRTSASTIRVSVSSSGAEANGYSSQPSVSSDGTWIAFKSDATNLASGDTNAAGDVFLRDRSLGVTTRMSVDSSGGQGDQDSGSPSISDDGQIVAFSSLATNLVSGDTNQSRDVFVRDRNTGSTERISVDGQGGQADGASDAPAASANGTVVAFESIAKLDPVHTSGKVFNIFLRDRAAATTRIASADCGGNEGDLSSQGASLSDDGQYVAYWSGATNLVDDDFNQAPDVFVTDFTIPPMAASWSNYGSGFTGTLGVPSLTPSDNPVLGTSITIDLSNSRGIWTPALLLVGLTPDSISTSSGGTLLVDPTLLLPLAIPPFGLSIPADLPTDPLLCGVSIYLQSLELDPGAQRRVSFTPGLQLTFGH